MFVENGSAFLEQVAYSGFPSGVVMLRPGSFDGCPTQPEQDQVNILCQKFYDEQIQTSSTIPGCSLNEGLLPGENPVTFIVEANGKIDTYPYDIATGKVIIPETKQGGKVIPQHEITVEQAIKDFEAKIDGGTQNSQTAESVPAQVIDQTTEKSFQVVTPTFTSTPDVVATTTSVPREMQTNHKISGDDLLCVYGLGGIVALTASAAFITDLLRKAKWAKRKAGQKNTESEKPKTEASAKGTKHIIVKSPIYVQAQKPVVKQEPVVNNESTGTVETGDATESFGNDETRGKILKFYPYLGGKKK